MSGPPAAKRPRLSLACNECRRRKVKCDAAYPKCQNCLARNDTCITTDPKRPGVEVTREWIEPPGDGGQQAADIHSENASQSSVGASIPRSLPNANANANASHGNMPPPATPIGISPVQQPYEMSFNTDHATDRIKMLGGSSSQCLTKSLDVYLLAAHVQPVSSAFRHGMQHAEEMEMPLSLSLPTLPESHLLEPYLSAFFDKIQPLYPIFDIDAFKSGVRKLAFMSSFSDLPRDQVPLLASAYLVTSLGADEVAQTVTEESINYLHAAASLLGHVILIPYLSAVQTLLLFTLVYRGQDKDGLGWQTLGMAIRIAHSLGLHRHSDINPSKDHAVQQRGQQLFHARIWAVCCCLEKMMQLEGGRPSSIDTVDYDQMMIQAQNYHGIPFLMWHMGLAQNQGLISQHIYGHQPGGRSSRQILLDTAKLDRALLSWVADIPEEFRPSNGLFCDAHEVHIAAFLAIQYYQTTISLHRAALIFPVSTFKAEVNLHCADDPSRLRLQGGEAICVSSARSIANIAIELSERDIGSHVMTGGPLLLACIVLAISLVKNPGKRIQAADLELLKACVDCTTTQYTKSRENAKFVEGINLIYERVRSHVDKKMQQPTGNSVSSSITRDDGHRQAIAASRWSNGKDAHDPHQSIHNGDLVVGERGAAISTEDSAIYNQTTSADAVTYDNYGQDPYFHNDVAGGVLMGAYDGNNGQDLYSNSLPFDNLNVEEIWNWMMIAGGDNVSMNSG